jgi:hypothetical protein
VASSSSAGGADLVSALMSFISTIVISFHHFLFKFALVMS